jgi:hypothetical protein
MQRQRAIARDDAHGVEFLRHKENVVIPGRREQGCRTKIFAFPAGQSRCSALNSLAAEQRRPTQDVKFSSCAPGATAFELLLFQVGDTFVPR